MSGHYTSDGPGVRRGREVGLLDHYTELSERFRLEPDFRNRYGPWAVVAGGSEGTGEAFARRLAAAGINLVLIARRESPLQKLASALESEHGVQVEIVVADLAAAGALDRVRLLTDDLDVGLFIYNAGATSNFARFVDWSAAGIAQMVALNCATVAAFAHHFGRTLSDRGRGGIILLGSMAGFAGSSFQSIYNATKAFDWILAEGLWHDLGGDGVDVVGLVLGATLTPSHDRKGVDFSQQTTMTSDEVAAEGLASIGRGPLHVVGEHNRAVVQYMLGRDRASIVSLMSQSSASIGRLPMHAVERRVSDW